MISVNFLQSLQKTNDKIYLLFQYLILFCNNQNFNIFDKTVLPLNFTILCKALIQQNCNALVTGTGLIRESCIYSMELFVYQEVDSGPIRNLQSPLSLFK